MPVHLDLPALPDGLGLVVVDMDGTLLDERGDVPAELWPLLERLERRDIVFVPASGRQYATLRHTFERVGDTLAFVAENGAYVVRGGREVSSAPLDLRVVSEIVADLRAAVSDGGADLGVVVCGKRSAYVERTDQRFLDVCEPYYRALEKVVDLDELPVGEQVVKVAVHDFGDSDRAAGLLTAYAGTQQVVVSGAHWVDVMRADVHKGHAVAALQDELGITPSRTVAFGDYLNDVEMLARAEASFAMANAHPDVLRAARHVAPSNAEGGVIQVLTALLDDTALR